MWIQMQSKMKSTQLKHTSNKQLITKTMKKQLSTAIKSLNLKRQRKKLKKTILKILQLLPLRICRESLKNGQIFQLVTCKSKKKINFATLIRSLMNMLLVKPKQWIRLPVPFVVTGLVWTSLGAQSVVSSLLVLRGLVRLKRLSNLPSNCLVLRMPWFGSICPNTWTRPLLLN